jgi:Phage stabilisation protein
MQIQILNGIYISPAADFRTNYPRNLVPVPKETGVSKGFLRPADGIEALADGPGTDRGGFNWNGVLYRVMGSMLVTQAADGTITQIGDVGMGGQVTMDEGFDRLAIWSAGGLYYWDGTDLTRVTDPDLGTVIDGCWVAGYFMSTDGTSLIVTELNDPTAVNPLKYGSAESDPDRIQAVSELRNEVYAFGRYTIEVFQNVGGDNFPFQRIDGAQVPKGVIGTHAYALMGQTFLFLGSGKGEAPAVYAVAAGSADKVSTAEIEQLLMSYTEEQLASVVCESKVEKGHLQFHIHLPDQCLVYDLAASQALQTPVWSTLDSGVSFHPETYRARNMVWCYDAWMVADPTSSATGRLTQDTMAHYGAAVAWQFGTIAEYNESRGFIVLSLELIGTPGRVPLSASPVIWHSYSVDGETWSRERPIPAGGQGQRGKRLQWRKCGKAMQYRMERFRGTSDARMSVARLEAELEALNG